MHPFSFGVDCIWNVMARAETRFRLSAKRTSPKPKPNTLYVYFIHKFLPSRNSLSGNSYLNEKAEMAFFFIHSCNKPVFTRYLNQYLSKLEYWFMLCQQVCWSCKRFGNNCHSHIFVMVKWTVLGYGSCRSLNPQLLKLQGGSLLPPSEGSTYSTRRAKHLFRMCRLGISSVTETVLTGVLISP